MNNTKFTPGPQFTCTKAEVLVIGKIIDRAEKLAEKHGNQYLDRMTAMMDLEACHSSHPLDLKRLLKADDFNFTHDVWGIHRHISRETGQLQNCFSPRCSLPEARAALAKAQGKGAV